MKLDARSNWMLFLVMVLLIGGNAMLFLYPKWAANRPTRDPSLGKNLPSCLKTSDFYSAHLTTYFVAAVADADADSKRKAPRHEQFCDQIPGPGLAVFGIDLMEQDARSLPVALSFSKSDPDGRRVLVKALPPNFYPGGVLTMSVPIAERGKYVLDLAFGEAKTKDDIIEMPILVGQ